MELVGKIIKFAWIPGLMALFMISFTFMTNETKRENTINKLENTYQPIYEHNFQERVLEHKDYPGNDFNKPEVIETKSRVDISIAMETINRKFQEMSIETSLEPEKSQESENSDFVDFTEIFSDPVIPENPQPDEPYIATIEDLLPLAPPMGAPPRNYNFVFHNKLPKSGSTTMKWLLVELEKLNNFKLDHQRYCINKDCFAKGRDDGPNGQRDLADYMKTKIQEVKDEKYILLKHHHWFNFTAYGLPQPTYINVARDPITRFASRYYFKRFGWERDGGGSRTNFNGKKVDKQRTLDECVLENLPECTDALQVMVKYFCGTTDECNKHKYKDSQGDGKELDWTKVARSTEIAKLHIVKEFYIIGLLEHFDESLHLFEKVLPEYFAGAFGVYNTPEIQEQRESSKAKKPAKYSNETRRALENGVLRYEMDIYNLIKSLFFQKLEYHNIPVTTF